METTSNHQYRHVVRCALPIIVAVLFAVSITTAVASERGVEAEAGNRQQPVQESPHPAIQDVTSERRSRNSHHATFDMQMLGRNSLDAVAPLSEDAPNWSTHATFDMQMLGRHSLYAIAPRSEESSTRSTHGTFEMQMLK